MTFFRLLGLCGFLVALPLCAEPIKVLVFGDSLAAGYGLPEDDGFMPQFERAIDEIGVEAEMVNAAIAGETTAGALARSDATYGLEHDVVFLELGANDMLRAVPPSSTRKNLEALILQSEKPVYLVGVRAFPTYGMAYAQQFDAIYPELADEFDTGFYPFIFQTIFADGVLDSWRYFQRDRLHLNKAGVEKLVEDLAPDFKNWLTEENYYHAD